MHYIGRAWVDGMFISVRRLAMPKIDKQYISHVSLFYNQPFGKWQRQIENTTCTDKKPCFSG